MSQINFYLGKEFTLFASITRQSPFHLSHDCIQGASNTRLSPYAYFIELIKEQAPNSIATDEQELLTQTPQTTLEKCAMQTIEAMQPTSGFAEFIQSLGSAIIHFEKTASPSIPKIAHNALQKALHLYRNKTIACDKLSPEMYQELNLQTASLIQENHLKKYLKNRCFKTNNLFLGQDISSTYDHNTATITHPLAELKISNLGYSSPAEITCTPASRTNFMLAWLQLKFEAYESSFTDIDLNETPPQIIEDTLAEEYLAQTIENGKNTIRAHYSIYQIALLATGFLCALGAPYLLQTMAFSSLTQLLTIACLFTTWCILWKESKYDLKIQAVAQQELAVRSFPANKAEQDLYDVLIGNQPLEEVKTDSTDNLPSQGLK